MLVLSRKLDEKIYIGSDIVVTVVSIDGQRVRLGIQAPDDVKILRSELAGPAMNSAKPVSGKKNGRLAKAVFAC